MATNSSDISAQLLQRLRVLKQQVEQDQAALKLYKSSNIPTDIVATGEGVYARLFDSLTATLHNLEKPQMAEEKSSEL